MIKWKRVFSDLVGGSAVVDRESILFYIQHCDSAKTPFKISAQKSRTGDVLFQGTAGSVPRAKEVALEFLENMKNEHTRTTIC